MRIAPETHPSLLIRLRDPSDDAAWTQFVEIYEPLIYRLVRRCGLQDADARDVAQQVLMKIVAHVKQWDPRRSRGSFRAWLAVVARNLAINLLVQHARHPRGSGDSRVQSQLNECAARPIESAEYQREYRRQVFRWAAQRTRHEFQPATWDAFWLTCVGGSSIHETADRLKLSIGSVYVARSRCMARLRAVVASLQDLSGEFRIDYPQVLGEATTCIDESCEGIDP